MIRFVDENLVGQPGLSRFVETNVEWHRDRTDYDITICVDKLCFTDLIDDKPEKNFAWLIEPSIINGENYTKMIDNFSKFKYVFSHNLWLKDKISNCIFCPHGGTWLRENDIKLHEKSLMTSMIFSYKQWNMFHRFRHRIYEEYKNFNIDFYGSGCEKPIEFKIEGLEKYRFSIVVENSNDPSYFTEKILDCMLTGTIPIYLGTPTISEFFNPEGIITFNDPDDLKNILPTLTEELYTQKFEAVKENFEVAKKYMTPEHFIQSKIYE